MRVVIDTNVIVSGIYDPESLPGRILDAGNVGSVILCAPESVRVELRRTLRKVLRFSPVEEEEALQGLRIEWLVEAIYEPFVSEVKRLLRDVSDAPVLGCAMALGLDIISGDKDLLDLRVEGIRVWAPAAFARRD